MGSKITRASSLSKSAVALTVVFVLPQLLAVRTAQAAALNGRLVLGAKGQVSDWRVVASSRLDAELPRGENGRPAGVAPGVDGAFTVELPDTATVFLCPYVGGRLAADAVLPIRVMPDQPLPEELTLTPQPPRKRVKFVLQRADEQPLGRKLKVHLYNVYGEIDGSSGGTWSDEAGVIAYERLPCTKYDLWIEPPAVEDDPLPGALFRGLDVPAGEGAHTIELEVAESGAVKGRILRADGDPVQGHTVAVETGTVPSEGSNADTWLAAYARGALECYAQAEVGADGTFVLRGLTPGKRSLDVRRPDERDAWSTVSGVEVTAGKATDLGTVELPANGWEYMFDRRTLDGWVESDFYGQKEVRIENDRIVLTTGTDMTGITWAKALPRIDYEVSLQAMRADGYDFFCGLTFPVEEDYCSLILGGWGGSVVGLSSLDGFDASENETSRWIQFDERRWYRVRVRVAPTNIKAWLDEDNIIDVDTADRDISTRIEVERSKPFGIATWCTTGAVRDIRIRRLDDGGE